MELFEEIVLTILMMYIGVKKAIALTKQIQQNAAVIASRFEIEEKSRSLEDIKKRASVTHEAPVNSGIVSTHKTISRNEISAHKLPNVDISWPKDIIEDESHLRILRNRTPSVSEIEENEGSDDKTTLQDNETVTEVCKTVENSDFPENHDRSLTLKKSKRSSESISEGNIVDEESKVDVRQGYNMKSDVLHEPLKISSENSLENTIKQDIVSHKTDENDFPNAVVSALGNKANISVKSDVTTSDTSDITSNDLTQMTTTILQNISKLQVEPVLIVKTALDDSPASTCSSDTITSVSSLKTSSGRVSERVKNADFVNKSKTIDESLKTIDTKIVKDNTVFLCSAKCKEETNVHNHLTLCGNGVIVGNSDMGQKVGSTSEEDDSEIFYSAACDEEKPFWLIFSGEYTKAMNKDWHSGHFCCWQCDESLTGQRYVLRDEHPYCIKCYESVFANPCEECSKIIGIDSKDLSYKDKHWHEACFLCNKCQVSLVDKQFGSKADKIYCGSCYDTQFASRCDGCGEIFRAGTKKMEYKTRQWHEHCFCCVVCKTAIGTKSFIPREQEIYCATCYEEKFATRCVKCNKIITSGGVTYKNEPWHRECFTCTNCSTSLAGQRFTSRDEKPYCADCFGELFAKRCTSCSKPITGIGGTRFISFEDRHWHNDCFICATCKTSLVGRGFITDGNDIICPDCAKAKLM